MENQFFTKAAYAAVRLAQCSAAEFRYSVPPTRWTDSLVWLKFREMLLIFLKSYPQYPNRSSIDWTKWVKFVWHQSGPN